MLYSSAESVILLCAACNDVLEHAYIVYSSVLADPWRYAAISIECVACNYGDLFNDRGISKKPEKHA